MAEKEIAYEQNDSTGRQAALELSVLAAMDGETNPRNLKVLEGLRQAISGAEEGDIRGLEVRLENYKQANGTENPAIEEQLVVRGGSGAPEPGASPAETVPPVAAEPVKPPPSGVEKVKSAEAPRDLKQEVSDEIQRVKEKIEALPDGTNNQLRDKLKAQLVMLDFYLEWPGTHPGKPNQLFIDRVHGVFQETRDLEAKFARPAAPAERKPKAPPSPRLKPAPERKAVVADIDKEAAVHERRVLEVIKEIEQKRISGEIAWDWVDNTLLPSQGLKPGTPEAAAFMEEWDREQAEKQVAAEEAAKTTPAAGGVEAKEITPENLAVAMGELMVELESKAGPAAFLLQEARALLAKINKTAVTPDIFVQIKPHYDKLLQLVGQGWDKTKKGGANDWQKSVVFALRDIGKSLTPARAVEKSKEELLATHERLKKSAAAGAGVADAEIVAEPIPAVPGVETGKEILNEEPSAKLKRVLAVLEQKANTKGVTGKNNIINTIAEIGKLLDKIGEINPADIERLRPVINSLAWFENADLTDNEAAEPDLTMSTGIKTKGAAKANGLFEALQGCSQILKTIKPTAPAVPAGAAEKAVELYRKFENATDLAFTDYRKNVDTNGNFAFAYSEAWSTFYRVLLEDGIDMVADHTPYRKEAARAENIFRQRLGELEAELKRARSAPSAPSAPAAGAAGGGERRSLSPDERRAEMDKMIEPVINPAFDEFKAKLLAGDGIVEAKSQAWGAFLKAFKEQGLDKDYREYAKAALERKFVEFEIELKNPKPAALAPAPVELGAGANGGEVKADPEIERISQAIAVLYNDAVRDRRHQKEFRQVYKFTRFGTENGELRRRNLNIPPIFKNDDAGDFYAIPIAGKENRFAVVPRLDIAIQEHNYNPGGMVLVYDMPGYDGRRPDPYNKVEVEKPAIFEYDEATGEWNLIEKGRLILEPKSYAKAPAPVGPEPDKSGRSSIGLDDKEIEALLSLGGAGSADNQPDDHMSQEEIDLLLAEAEGKGAEPPAEPEMSKEEEVAELKGEIAQIRREMTLASRAQDADGYHDLYVRHGALKKQLADLQK